MHAADMGDYPTAFQYLEGAVELARGCGDQRHQSWSLSILVRAHVLDAMAGFAVDRGDHDGARRLVGTLASLAARDAPAPRRSVRDLTSAGQLAVADVQVVLVALVGEVGAVADLER
jgi:hypothetical protein